MSTIKVDKIEKRSGSTLTLGGPGTAVTLACGATQSGFGRTGTVDWCTTAKTGPLTIVSGNGYFINTSGGAITVTLPSSPTAGDIVALKDYANTWDDACKAVTLNNNGSKINGICSTTTLSTESQSVTLIYVDGTKGWQDIHDSTANVSGNPGYIAASGGTETTSGDFKIHTFNSSDNFVVTNVGTPSAGGDSVSYVVVAGGASGGSDRTSTTSSAGGGAGGFREGKVASGGGSDPYSASPLVAPAGLTITATTYPITVGAGGAAAPGPSGPTPGLDGAASTFSSITSAGGGGGSGLAPSPNSGRDGGSGGGAKQDNNGGPSNGVGIGNTPPVSPPQGNNGGQSDRTGPTYLAGGGGGAGAVGGSPTTCGSTTGPGGAGVASSISGSPVLRAGGGGAGKSPPSYGSRNVGTAGPGGGGAGQPGPGTDPSALGTANTGGGGGGAFGGPNPSPSCGGTGGSGIVIIRYKYQN
tara:strand:+ start:1164 stop:2573 length:1410 start_codon:yes stop_codon:yes gene_type:complete